MRAVGAFEAKNKLGQLLDEVEQGEEIVITRRGKEIARLVPVNPTYSRARRRQRSALCSTVLSRKAQSFRGHGG
jgi:prevent-host-death family protein